MRSLLVLLLSFAGASGVLAQPVRAVAEDGRTMFLYDDFVWVDSAAVFSGLRAGEPVRSVTGRFVVHMPEGWTSDPPTGEMLQGEILFVNRADSTYLSPQFIPDSLLHGDTPRRIVDALVSEMAPGPESGFEAGPLRMEVIDGHRVLSRRVLPLEGSRWGTLQASVIEAVGGVVFVIGTIQPGAGDEHHTELLRSIEVLD